MAMLSRTTMKERRQRRMIWTATPTTTTLFHDWTKTILSWWYHRLRHHRLVPIAWNPHSHVYHPLHLWSHRHAFRRPSTVVVATTMTFNTTRAAFGIRFDIVCMTVPGIIGSPIRPKPPLMKIWRSIICYNCCQCHPMLWWGRNRLRFVHQRHHLICPTEPKKWSTMW